MLIDEETCALFVEHGAYLTMTLCTYRAIAREGVEAGIPESMQRKVYELLEAGERALERERDLSGYIPVSAPSGALALDPSRCKQIGPPTCQVQRIASSNLTAH